MRIHSDTLTQQDFTNAAEHAGVKLVDIRQHGSQSRARAFEFTLSGNGRNGGQWGTQDYKTATWDEWGIVFAHLFDVDPNAHCLKGQYGYQNAEHYHWSTGERFRHLTPAYQHKRHKWDHAYGTAITGSYHVYECNCGATQRHMAIGHDWSELVS